MKNLLISFLAALAFSINAFCMDNETVKSAVVKVFTVMNSPDYNQPWQTTGQKNTSGSGCIIEGNRILTNAHVVSDAAYIQLLRFGESKKYAAEVSAVDHDCDLALLTVKDPEFFKGAPQAQIGSVPSLGDKVSVYGFPVGGEKLSVTEGIVSRIEVGQYAHTGSSMMLVQIDAAINPGNSGGPVIKNGKLVGIAFEALQRAENIGYIIPTLIINHFLKDAAGKKYGGFPKLGIRIQHLENAVQREKIGLAKNQSGVLITFVEFDTPAWGVLKEGDVIMSIDGKQIANDGTIAFRGRERLDFGYILNTKYSGEKVRLKVFRDKKASELDVKLFRTPKMVPFREYDKKPTYYIFGGFVFTRLSGNHLEYLGGGDDGGMYKIADAFFDSYRTPDKQEVLMLQFVLPDELTEGYHEYEDKLVQKINGKAVAGMKDLISVFEGSKDKYIEVELADRKFVVIDVEKSRAENARIMEKYNIPFDRSEDLRDKPKTPGEQAKKAQ